MSALEPSKVTVTCECGQIVEHEQWCRAVPQLLSPSGTRVREAAETLRDALHKIPFLIPRHVSVLSAGLRSLDILTEHLERLERERDEAREVFTKQHSILWLLGLDTHEGEEPSSRENAHSNLDALLDGDIEDWPSVPTWVQVDEANTRYVAAEARVQELEEALREIDLTAQRVDISAVHLGYKARAALAVLDRPWRSDEH